MRPSKSLFLSKMSERYFESCPWHQIRLGQLTGKLLWSGIGDKLPAQEENTDRTPQVTCT